MAEIEKIIFTIESNAEQINKDLDKIIGKYKILDGVNEQQKKSNKQITDQKKQEAEATQKAAADEHRTSLQKQKNLIAEKQKQNEYNQALRQQVAESRAVEGSIKSLSLEIQRLRTEYNNLSKAERENKDIGGELKIQLQDKQKELKTLNKGIDESAGKFGNLGKMILGFGAASLGVATVSAAIGKFKDVVVNTMQATGTGMDRFEQRMRGMEFATKEFYRSLASGNWDNFFSNIRKAYEEGVKYEQVLQSVQKTQRALGVVQKEIMQEITELNEKGANVELQANERIEAYNNALTKQKEINKRNIDEQEKLLNNSLKLLKATGQTETELRKMLDNYIRIDAENKNVRTGAEAYNKALDDTKDKISSLEGAINVLQFGDAMLSNLGRKEIENTKNQLIKAQSELTKLLQRDDIVTQFAGIIRTVETATGEAVDVVVDNYKKLNDLRLIDANDQKIYNTKISKIQKMANNQAKKEIADNLKDRENLANQQLQKEIADFRKNQEIKLKEVEIKKGTGYEYKILYAEQINDYAQFLKMKGKLSDLEYKDMMLSYQLALKSAEDFRQGKIKDIQDSELKEIEARIQKRKQLFEIQQKMDLLNLELEKGRNADYRKLEIEQIKSTADFLMEIGEILPENYELMLKEYEVRRKKLLEEIAENEKKAAESGEDLKKRMQETVNSIKELALSLTGFFNTVIQGRLNVLGSQIGEQEKKIAEVENKLNDNFNKRKSVNAKQLELERQRLADLEKERRKALDRQRAIALTEMALNSAVAVSKAAAEGGIAAPITIAAVLISLAAGFLTAKQQAESAGFYEGGYTGDGNIKDKSNKLGNRGYTYHKGEFVMPAKITNDNREHFENILKGKLDLTSELAKSRMFDEILTDRTLYKLDMGKVYNITTKGTNNKGVEKRLDELNKRINRLNMVVNIDKDGFYAGLNKSIKKTNKLNKLTKI